MTRSPTLEVPPWDAELVANASPESRERTAPADRYDLVVIGGGTAGLVAAAGAATLGARVALVEKALLGGDCLTFGCVPSKALLRTGRFYRDARHAARFTGRRSEPSEEDFAAAMQRMRRLRAQLSRHDSAQRLAAYGVDILGGEARFVDGERISVGGRRLRFRRALVATGTHARSPSIEGLEEAGFQTNETVFDLTSRPRRLLVIGGGPLGCEFAQAFARLGCEVTIVNRDPYFLPGEERDAADILADALRRDGVQVHLDSEVVRVERRGNEKVVVTRNYDHDSEIPADEILVGAGRVPNVRDLGLEAAGVAFDEEEGVRVDDFLRTTNRRIFAAGDVASEYRYTHMADASARIAVENALFWRRKRLSRLTIPWCTYTDPEIAHVGAYVEEEKPFSLKTFTVPMADVDRAVLDAEEDGFVKIHIRDGTDRIVGATIVARHAGEMINEISLAMVAGIGLRTLGTVIHSYPTQAEAIKKAADAWSRTRLTPAWKRVVSAWLAARWGRRR